ncbi:UDP-3-O-(3-hydroxymyristoyl)glucosamine N-acyltransferase [Ideonella lacteola]|uniref:UDP-3-O-(3-hydroxymyristoyl)glucosamine N-acyltransferase n=1 Tax=Ideonella lacteola TaxID=2984193 RepID=UPI003BF9966F
MAVRLADIAAALGGELRGDGERVIERIGPLEAATPHTISFLAQPRLKPLLDSTNAGAVIVREDACAPLVARGVAAIVVPDPYLAFARLTRWWAARTRPAAQVGVHPTAYVAPGARLHDTVSVGPFAVVEANAVLAEHVVVGAHAVVGEGADVGAGTQLRPRSTLAQGCRVGARGIIHSGAVIGSDGFGFAPHQGRWEKIEQLGGVWIGDDVEIGANTCVDRGALDDTVIEDGVKLDNLIQIAHNVHIGAHTAMAGCVGVAGSAKIGKHCTFGGAAMILGHLQIADHVHISAASVVMSSILKPGQYSGVFPIDENANWEKNAATLRQLHTLRARLRTLEKKSSP